MSKSCLPSAALTSPTRAFTVGWSNSDRQSLGACDGAVLDRAIADHRIGQVHVFDLGLQLAAVLFGDLAAEDDSDLVRLADGPVDVEQAFAQFVERGAATKDQIVAEFDLGEEQAVLAPRLFALSCSEKRGEAGQPFRAAGR